MFSVGVLVFFALIYYCILSSSIELSVFFDTMSIVFVLISYISLLLFTNSFKEFKNGIKVLFNSKIDLDIKEIRQSIDIFSLLFVSSFFISIIGMILGVIILLTLLSDPSSIGPAMAVIFLVLFYVALIDFIIICPAKYKLKKIEKKLSEN